MKVLLIGSGGREHALAAALNADPQLEELHVAPGNPGIAAIALCHAINTDDNDAVIELAKKLSIDLIVVGPEKPLANGVSDAAKAAGIACFTRRAWARAVSWPVTGQGITANAGLNWRISEWASGV